jgi:uncharacterized coiled-coil DUF342 family protein
MTPEERLSRIENVLQATVEQQARQQEQLGRFGQEIEKQNDGIRSLIVVARTCLDSIKELREDHKQVTADIDKLREAQSSTDEKLNILVDTVDRIIRRRNDQSN